MKILWISETKPVTTFVTRAPKSSFNVAAFRAGAVAGGEGMGVAVLGRFAAAETVGRISADFFFSWQNLGPLD